MDCPTVRRVMNTLLGAEVAIVFAKTFGVDLGRNLCDAVETIRRADSLELSIRKGMKGR